MYNKVVLVGNLTRDVELRYGQSGNAIASTAIATSHKFTSNGEKKEEVCYTDITFFGKSGEIANQYLRRGSKILIEGRLKFDQWVDQNGNKRSKHTVIVEQMKMLDSKSDAQNGQQQSQEQQQPSNYQQRQQQQSQAPQQQQPQQQNQQQQNQQNSIPEMSTDEDEIPF